MRIKLEFSEKALAHKFEKEIELILQVSFNRAPN